MLPFQPRRPEGYCQGAHCDAPEDKGEPQEGVQGQKVQATGSETEENPRYPSGSESTRCQPEDHEGDQEECEIPTAQVCPEGLEFCG